MSRRNTQGRSFRPALLLVACVILFRPGTARAQAIQGCDPTAYVDVRTGTHADRTLTWDFSVADNPKRCMQIQTGQGVTWDGNLDAHPLAQQGGDTPNPIGTHQVGETVTVTFNSVGTFGYKCVAHSSLMFGAIKVVAAPASAPALSPLVVSALGALFVAVGVALLRKRRAQAPVS